MLYKKRARSGWESGKIYKKDSNRSERMYEKKEVKEALGEMADGEDYRYRYPTKKRLDPEQKIKRSIHRFEHIIERWTRPNNLPTCSMITSAIDSFKHHISELKKKLSKIIKKG